MGTCHPMATLKYIDSVTSFPQIICYIIIVVLKVLKLIKTNISSLLICALFRVRIVNRSVSACISDMHRGA